MTVQHRHQPASSWAGPEPATHRAEVRGVELAYWHEGRGGVPLLLLHGWPETRRIWAKVVAPLADAGFEVVAPDLRGFGDSGLAPDGFYDRPSYAQDCHALLVHLGHDWCIASGGDVGGAVIQELGLRHPGFVRRQVLMNTVVPTVEGGPQEFPREHRPTADYYLRQARDADGLAAELDTPERRRAYIAGFYTHRLWGAPGAFTAADVDYMTEPYADGAKLRASFANYESSMQTRPLSEPPRAPTQNPVETLVLYGPEDHVVQDNFPERCEAVFPNLVGPFVVPRAGHFLQWERPELLVRTLVTFCRDLLAPRGAPSS